MNKNKIDSNFYKLYSLIVTLIFGLIAFTKFTKIYETIRFGSFAPIYAALTLAIIGVIYFLIKCRSHKVANITATILYTLVSIILLIDSAYFSYMNKFTSIANLKLLSLIGAVGESVSEVNPLKYLWMPFDIPLILIYEIFIDSKLYIWFTKKIKFEVNVNKIKISKVVALVVSIVVFVVYGNSIGFKLKYVKSENIIYHIRDFVNVTFNFEKEIDYNEYFKIKEVNKDENYGIANGKNVVIIQVEALQNFVINREYNGQELTPFLNSLVSGESFYFNNYFYQVGAGNTSDAEFAVNNSLLSTNTDAAYMRYNENDYYGLPYILKDNGYTNITSFHAFLKDYWNRNEAYVGQGFDNFYAYDDYTQDEVIGLGLSDKSFLKQTVEKIEELEEPFYSFIVTLSSHHPFELDENYCNIELKDEHEDTLFGNYLNAINYVDSALEEFFDELKKNGLYENTVFVIYGDHFAIPNYNVQNSEFVSDLVGHEYSYKDMFNVPLIIHVPGVEKTKTIETVAGHVDVLPTLLHLLGIENNKGIMLGSDLFSVSENIVYEMMHIGDGSYVTSDVFYYASTSGIDVFNKAYDMKTGEEIKIINDMIKQSEKAVEFVENARALLKVNKIIR